jgi:hypothetical protein
VKYNIHTNVCLAAAVIHEDGDGDGDEDEDEDFAKHNTSNLH